MKRALISAGNIMLASLISLLLVAIFIPSSLSQAAPKYIPKSPRTNYQDTNINGNNRVFIVYATCDGNHEGHDSFLGKAIDHFLGKRHPKLVVSTMSPWGRHIYGVEKCAQKVGYMLIIHNPDAEPRPKPGDSGKDATTQTTSVILENKVLTHHQ